MICIIDYGMGNLRSVEKAFLRLKTEVKISSKPEDIQNASTLILPGVGHFAKGMENLFRLGLVDILNKEALENKKPILGICLGMQLMTRHSEEGNCNGLGWIEGKTLLFPKSKLKIPHIGWNNIQVAQQHPVLSTAKPSDYFYFAHSYYVHCAQKENILCTTEYGVSFHSGIVNENIIGLQFHPEKSHQAGLSIIQKFIDHHYV